MSSAMGKVMEAWEDYAEKKARYERLADEIKDESILDGRREDMTDAGAAFSEAVNGYVDDRIKAALKVWGLG